MKPAARQIRRDSGSESRMESFAPPDEGISGIAWVVLALVAGTFTMFNLSGNVWPEHAGQADARAQAAATAAQAGRRASTEVSRDAATQRPPARGTDRRASGRDVVSKCVEQGATSFSDQPCAPGAHSEQVLVDPERNLLRGYCGWRSIDAATAAAPSAPAAAARYTASRLTACASTPPSGGDSPIAMSWKMT
jgi:hypothetical protein